MNVYSTSIRRQGERSGVGIGGSYQMKKMRKNKFHTRTYYIENQYLEIEIKE